MEIRKCVNCQSEWRFKVCLDCGSVTEKMVTKKKKEIVNSNIKQAKKH